MNGSSNKTSIDVFKIPIIVPLLPKGGKFDSKQKS